jgi:peptidoglycan/LPS O-acetylase OafA/YrhL
MRGISCAIVVICHCALWLPPALPDSYQALPKALPTFILSLWWGLDVFFVLSGFLIGRILLTQIQKGGPSYRAFYVRRFFRVFPVYYLVLTVSVFFFSRLDEWKVLYGGIPFEETLARSWANYLYVSNYVYGMQFANPMSWGWSLCVEEHFYLTIPVLLGLLFRIAGVPWRGLFLAALTLVPLLFRWQIHARDPGTVPFTWVHPMSHTHADGLAFGVLVAYLCVFHRERTGAWVARLGSATWILGLACYGAVMLWGGLWAPGAFRVVWQFFIVSIGSSLLILNGIFLDNRATRFLGLRVWVPFARASYGQYLTHLFVVFWALAWWPRGAHSPAAAVASVLAFCLVVLSGAVAAGLLLYLMVERPFLDLGSRLAGRYLARRGEPAHG